MSNNLTLKPASTNAVDATVATPVSDMNDCEVCLVAQRDARIALVLCGHQCFLRPARTRWDVRDVDVPSAAGDAENAGL